MILLCYRKPLCLLIKVQLNIWDSAQTVQENPSRSQTLKKQCWILAPKRNRRWSSTRSFECWWCASWRQMGLHSLGIRKLDYTKWNLLCIINSEDIFAYSFLRIHLGIRDKNIHPKRAFYSCSKSNHRCQNFWVDNHHLGLNRINCTPGKHYF